MATKKTITEETIRELAHKLWLEEGQPEGHADRHWFTALEQIANTNMKAAAKKKAPAKAKAAPAKKTAAKKAA